ncbi:MAG: DUF2857 family protein [Burkholderiales bacterium]|nr:DUF2857 family protein [Burkholderiales bacterium]
MFAITCPTLKRLILEHLVERMEEGPDALDELLRTGVDPLLLDMLRQRPARDFVNAAKVEQLVITANFDGRAVIASFGRLDAIKRDNEMREYFVINGAPPELLSQLFKLSVDEIRTLRSVLFKGTQSGRPKFPPVALRERIHNDWARLAKEQPAAQVRERLYQLHLLHDAWTIQSLWCTLNEFEENPSVRRRSAR